MPELDDTIRGYMLAAIQQRVFPGGVVGYIRDGTAQILPFGNITYQNDAPSVGTDTLYDLASVTKSVCTASVILALIEQGHLTLDDPVIWYIPELTAAGRETILIRHLLAFSAVFDLPQSLSSYASEGSEALLHRIFTTPLRYPAGAHFLYADIPYILLGLVAERISGTGLDELADAMFFGPLHMRYTTFHPTRLAGVQIAPTTVSNGQDVIGEPHDEKALAFYKAGRAVGHAGLFSTAPDLLRFCRMILQGGELDGRRYLTDETIGRMQTEVIGDGTLGFSFGWTTQASYMSQSLPAGTFGKSGFTGTQVFISPATQRCLVLLTNRMYPKHSDNSKAVSNVRRTLADLVLA
jgi:CubicO group peptidase (beta-lactamase class C family)